ncbi:MAG: agmatinase, partial [Bacteroidales bacterium]|nr:agmatinase [Bacteroidales bacterium]
MRRIYADIPEEYSYKKNSKIAILPVAYDGTSTWGKGADKGPDAFLHASENMELYDIETDSEVYKQGVYLYDELSGFETPDKMVEAVYNKTKEIIKTGKLFTMIGGEHSVSIGAMRAIREEFGEITVLHLDAHSDLRAEYDGTIYNHACAMHEISKHSNLIQVGIRSMDVSEKEFLNKNKTFFAHDIHKNPNWIDDVVSLLCNKVYISIDLDVFDPSELPSTGTPEPGGLKYYEVIDLMRKTIAKSQIIGLDVVE